MSSFSSPPSEVVRTLPHNKWQCQSIFEAVDFIWIKEIGWIFFEARSLFAECRFFNYRERDWQDIWRKSLHHQPNEGTGFSGVSKIHQNSSVHQKTFQNVCITLWPWFKVSNEWKNPCFVYSFSLILWWKFYVAIHIFKVLWSYRN